MSRPADTDAVAAVLAAYTQGTRSRDTAAIRRIFHPNAVMVGYLGPNLTDGGIDPFLAALEGNAVGPDYASAITSIQVTGATASATVVEDNLFGLSFVNHFHLIRQSSGAWVITSKLFHHD